MAAVPLCTEKEIEGVIDKDGAAGPGMDMDLDASKKRARVNMEEGEKEAKVTLSKESICRV